MEAISLCQKKVPARAQSQPFFPGTYGSAYCLPNQTLSSSKPGWFTQVPRSWHATVSSHRLLLEDLDLGTLGFEARFFCPQNRCSTTQPSPLHILIWVQQHLSPYPFLNSYCFSCKRCQVLLLISHPLPPGPVQFLFDGHPHEHISPSRPFSTLST